MEGQDEARSSESGVTLIEVMISIVVFSIMLGMASDFVKKGMEHSFVAVNVEDWLNLIEESSKLVSTMAYSLETSLIGTDDFPYSKIKKPMNLKDWSVKWEKTNLPNVRAAQFHAISLKHQSFKWIVFKVIDEK